MFTLPSNLNALKFISKYNYVPSLIKVNWLSQDNSKKKKLLHYLCKRIEATGPITVAEYMKEVLTSPQIGYYMTQDVFGNKGDFITSPEISQIFGELIGIWFFTEWSKIGRPQPLQLVEFGPGRGSLADDFLRVFKRFSDKTTDLEVHFIEASPHMCQLQKTKLCNGDFCENLHEKTLKTKYDYPITWHKGLESVPEKFSFFLAHEFFDALPVHKFQKTKDGWREVLIGAQNEKLNFVLSRNETPASKMLILKDEKREHVEISPESGILLDKIMKRMEEDGGITLIVDYGHNGNKTDTFRSFKNHKLHDPLESPGEADLTADVDFSYLIKQARDKALAFGPLEQGTFLNNMGINIRLEKLLQNAEDQQKTVLKSGVDMLTRSDQMGERFKFVALYPLVLKDFLEKYPPVGFST